MKARKYIDRIEVLRAANTPDGHGGNTSTYTSIGFSFANIKTVRVDRLASLGLNDNKLVIEVNLRERDDLNYNVADTLFRYKGIVYTILRIEPVDLNEREIKILCGGKG